MNKIPRVVLTGGPDGGKSTSIEYIKTNMPNIHIIEEAATQLLREGFPMPTLENPWTPKWQLSLEIEIIKRQRILDKKAQRDAKSNGAKLIVQDRCILDGAAYVETIDEFEKLTKLSFEEMINEYNYVIFIHSYANFGHYIKETNEYKFEDEDKAARTNRKTFQIWKSRKGLIEINEPDFNTRMRQIIKIIKSIEEEL